MIIKTLERTYNVLQMLPSGRTASCFVCSRDDSEGLYVVDELKDRSVISSSVDFLTGLKGRTSFTDFEECFFSQESMYVVFKYREGKSLLNSLNLENVSLRERLAMVRAILEKLLLQDMPVYLIWDAMDEGQIFFAAGMEAVFRYNLSDIDHYREKDFKAVIERFSAILELIFHQEIQDKSLPILGEFMEKLKDGECADLPALFALWDSFQKRVEALPEMERIKPRTWPFRLWDAIVRLFPIFRRILAVVLLIVAFIFLFFTIRQAMDSGGPNHQFDKIGDLDIRE